MRGLIRGSNNRLALAVRDASLEDRQIGCTFCDIEHSRILNAASPPLAPRNAAIELLALRQSSP
jgi:hypothetical protein